MIKIIATLCSILNPTNCHDQPVASFTSMTGCMAGAPQITQWAAREHPEKRLAGWKCFIGERRERI